MSESIVLPLRQLDTDIDLPRYAYEGDAGLDLRSTVNATLKPFERMLVPCGISVAIPQGFAGLVIPRSGLAANHGLSIVNAPGLIDSNYRGEIKVILINLDSQHDFEIKRGDRIAQLLLTNVPTVSLEVVEILPESVRGTGGFGSSGIDN